MQVGHQPRDLIISCSFSKQLCSADNFSWFLSADFFNCYTFNGVDSVPIDNISAAIDQSETSSTEPADMAAALAKLEQLEKQQLHMVSQTAADVQDYKENGALHFAARRSNDFQSGNSHRIMLSA